MKLLKISSVLLILLSLNCKNTAEKVVDIASDSANALHKTTAPKAISIIPINHATMILAFGDMVVYVDPVGGAKLFKDQESPDYILITDIHSDHFDPKTLQELSTETTIFIMPQAVKEKMPNLESKQIVIMNNGDIKEFDSLSVEAIPMYNLRKEALQFHEKGRGNGYLLTMDHKRIYISGDTEDIPEMRNLKDIDIAFICMNLPYTMTVESAASAVLDFKPKKVYPYHYRGTDGLSDVTKFKTLVNNENSTIDVVQLDWYSEQ